MASQYPWGYTRVWGYNLNSLKEDPKPQTPPPSTLCPGLPFHWACLEGNLKGKGLGFRSQGRGCSPGPSRQGGDIMGLVFMDYLGVILGFRV